MENISQMRIKEKIRGQCPWLNCQELHALKSLVAHWLQNYALDSSKYHKMNEQNSMTGVKN